MKRLSLILGVMLVVFFLHNTVLADEIDDIGSQLQTLQRDLKASQDASKPLEEDLNKLKTRLATIQSHVSSIEKEVVLKETEVKKGEAAFAEQKEVLDIRVPEHYKNAREAEATLLNLLVSADFSRALNSFFYQKKLADEDKKTILRIVLKIQELEEKKKSLESEKTRLAVIKKTVDEQATFLGGEVGKAKQYQSELQGKIASLTARQQSLIGQKLAGLNIPRSAGTSSRGCSSDLTNGKNPGFSPAIGFFTYGAPHRNGLNQYGAKGRADAGQSYTDMLGAYYTDFQLSDYDPNATIIIDGTNEYGQTFSNESMNLEDYTKHLYEMPSSWPAEALKAQAVAARTYALRIMRVHGRIQPNQGHQVVKKETNASSWTDAVDQTRGKVMLRGGEPFLSEYASTHGGYVQNLGKFDGTGGNPTSFAELNERAYDKASPWFYCNWGARSQYGGTAWLKSEEVADIANVILLVRKDSSNGCFVYQTDKTPPSPDRECPQTGNWSAEEVRQKLGGDAISTASSVEVSGVDWGSGKTTQVKINGREFNGEEFKNFFNLRAPANIQIVGPLFNIERK